MPKVEVPLTPVHEIPSEGSKIVEFFGRELHIVRGAEGGPAAFMNVCVHFGGTLVCSDGQFVCQWHGATFDACDGRRMSGPAAEGSGLMLLPTEIRDGVLTYVFAWGEDVG
ncbi:MAG: Rieske 2Fe-2S domain-containing protein [Dehalococcoidia bacterium]